ncbi:TonB-dependent receptor [Pontibacter sp. G13]|uniref:SusC/RagA family TonB-linked outer membrane protein n=1 Tax=Pontibacter sp. G13 TaxID=3074898 RepID=UPI00288990A3|nr:TonB-dependent receptor [Pontibacter sp. G13]WNJ17660.1 TonB-dependent receptor [Pontibacter sp. G13]
MVRYLHSICTQIAVLVLLCGLPFAAMAQSTVSGKVTSATDGMALPGATVLVKGTTVGAFADDNGSFSIEVPGENSVLIISYIGFVKQEIPVNGQSNITVVLTEDRGGLEEVIITGYTAQSRKDVVGAVSSVSSEDISALPVVGPEQALQGRAPGVTVSTEGGPGGAAYVRVRGIGTINNNNPLYIIDGVPVGSGLNGINPNDIDNIQVLKDASAASIYGSRAANGVVIVNTKQGDVAGTTINFDAYYGTQRAGNFPELLTPQELADVIWQADLNAGLTPNHPQYGSGAQPVLPTKLNDFTTANQSGTNWFDEIFNPAPIQSYNLSVSGGNQSGSYFLSTNYFNQDGVVLGTYLDRYTIRANSNGRVNDKITVGENMTVAYSRRNTIDNQNVENPISMALRMPSIVPVYDDNGNFAGSGVGGVGNAQNPVAELTRNADDYVDRLRLLANAYLTAEIVEGLTFRSTIGVQYNTQYGVDYSIQNPEAAEPRSSNALNEGSNYYGAWTWSNTIRYKTDIGTNHHIDVFAGTEAVNQTFRQINAGRTTFFTDDIDFRYLNSGEAGITNGSFGSSSSLFSVFGKAAYNFADRYLVDATIRRDGSSRFGENNPYGVFPAFSGAWRISEEAFMEDVSFVDDLKLRVGWGKMGNQSIGDYSFANQYRTNLNLASYDITGSNTSVLAGYDLAAIGNPDLRWETSTTTNIGIDATLMNGRINVILDAYERITSDMLLRKPKSAFYGVADVPFVNIGDMRNRGFDLGISFANKAGAEFTYDLQATISAYKNEVTKLSDQEDAFISGGSLRSFTTTRTESGMPLAYFFGYEVEGIFNTAEEVANHPMGQGGDNAIFSNPEDGVGRFIYADTNGDGIVSDDDRTMIGSPHPDFTYSLNSTFGYKNFDLNIFLQGTQGNDLYQGNRYFTDFFSFQGNRGVAMMDAWTPENTDATLPQLNSTNPNDEAKPSSYFIEDGSYLRVKNVTLGYTMPSSVADKIGMKKLRIYVQGSNLLTFTNYSGLDPEVSLDNFFGSDTQGIGIDRGNYPVTRQFVIGVNLGI